MDGTLKISSLFDTDRDLVEMRKLYPEKFFEVFKQGFDLYIQGDWSAARDVFNTVEEVKGMPDQPTRNLIEIMRQENFKAPSSWNGYRELTEK